MSEKPPIEFVLRWINSVEGEPVQTVAEFNVLLDGRAVWPVIGEPGLFLEIYVDDLLSYLTEFWKPLMLRQTYPVRDAPDRPSKLRTIAERRWAELPPSTVEREDENVTAFEQAHDLSRAFSGLFGLPSLYFFRAGDLMLVDAPGSCGNVKFVAARDSLSALGDRIAERLENIQGGKWSALVSFWRSRDLGDPTQLLAWATSLKPEIARSLIEEHALRAPQNVSEAANDDDELRLAARMSSALPPEQIRQVLALVRKFERHQANDFDRLARAVTDHVWDEFARYRPFQQGEAAATFVRQYLALPHNRWLDIFKLIEDLGVELHTSRENLPTLDGLAVWGPKHGPAVLINASSQCPGAVGYSPKTSKARVTAAHELCHLLLDHGHALTAVDVLNSRMPVPIESRAKAFAGELLLPGQAAANIWFGMDQPRTENGLRRCLRKLFVTYGVTRSVAAWKLEHGLQLHGIDLAQQLDQIVPQR